jgi:DNA-binding transcriptional MerR regulator
MVAEASIRRPIDLARAHGLSAQAVRNYESEGVLPPAERTASGYRRYTEVHEAALRAYLALIAAHGYATSGTIMRAVNDGSLDAALQAIDASHAQLSRDRETLNAVSAAIGELTSPPPASNATGPLTQPPSASNATESPARPRSVDEPGGGLPISALAHRLRLKPATLRKWERAGILTPVRDPVTHYRVYSSDDVRDADLAHLLRRGGYPLAHIATVLRHVREAGGANALADSLHDWRERLTARGRAMLTAAARLAEYLEVSPRAAGCGRPRTPPPVG